MAQDKAIMRALMEALGESGAPSKSLRPKMRPKGKSVRPKMRPETIGNTSGSEGTRGIDPKENYSAEDFERLIRSSKGMKSGGKVKGYKGGGCVMAGRGGSYKGMK